MGISYTALFDLEEADKVFQAEGMVAYRQHMLEREDVPLETGTAMPLVKALLELKAKTPEGEKPYAEVVVMSRNSPETGTRIFNTIRSVAVQRSGGPPT